MNESPDIFFLTEKQLPDPEARAMLAGFYSRSTESIRERIKNKSIDEIKTSLRKYAIGYGHKSLLDMADTPLMFVEDVSILACKALEFCKLGNYQETSTRYLDFSKQNFFDPLKTKTELSALLLNNWLNIYSFCIPLIKEELQTRFPYIENKSISPKIHEKAINAKVFDITRSLLPTAMKTNVGIKMSLSSSKEWLKHLVDHPLPEVRFIADLIYSKLHELFPYSFDSLFQFVHQQKTLSDFNPHEFYYYIDDVTNNDETRVACFDIINAIHSLSDQEYTLWNLLSQRKNPNEFFEFPAFFSKLGSIKIEFTLDYGSWRDLQRHRNVLYNQCSILTGGIEQFAFEDYFECLENNDIKEYLELAIFKQFEAIKKLKHAFELPEEEYQYLYPLGTKVHCQLVCSLPELVYILELRSSTSVHYTLRKKIQEIYSKLPREIKRFIAVNQDSSPFEIKRGTQDIVLKEGNHHA